MNKNIDISWQLAKEITERAVDAEIKGEPKEFTNTIAPIISNVIYAIEKDLLQEERFRIIVHLSRRYPDLEVFSIIETLEFEIKLKTN
jgi:hypothetical protein